MSTDRENEEFELQEKLGQAVGERNEYGALKPPLPEERERLALIPCITHGQDPTCTCSAKIDVDLDLYHIAVLYPGMIGRALKDYFANHYGEFKEAFEAEGIGL